MKLKTILLSLLLLISHSAFANHNLDFSLSDYCDESPVAKAKIKNGIYYHPKQAKPYSGESICFYKTGQLYAKSKYKDGLLNGKKTMHWENGRQSFEGNFVDDQINGKETWWYESGQIKSEKYYKDSKLDDKYTEWYENGQKSVEANFIYFKLDGEVTYYRKNGTTKKLEYYENGVLVKCIGCY